MKDDRFHIAGGVFVTSGSMQVYKNYYDITLLDHFYSLNFGLFLPFQPIIFLFLLLIFLRYFASDEDQIESFGFLRFSLENFFFRIIHLYLSWPSPFNFRKLFINIFYKINLDEIDVRKQWKHNEEFFSFHFRVHELSLYDWLIRKLMNGLDVEYQFIKVSLLSYLKSLI